jgi:twitching motility protein PilT
VIETGRKFGMQSIDDAIMKLLTAGIIDPEQAYNKAATKSKFREFLTTPPQDFTEV